MSNQQPISTLLGIAAAVLLATCSSGFGVNPCPEDTNGDGTVNVLDLIELLLCFGQPNLPPCTQEDINGDNTVNVLDLIDLLLAFGTVCPQRPCDVVCHPLKTPEGEPVCADEYVDNFNGGCNSTPEVFGSVACGESICGEYGTFTVAAVANRDTDWYAITTVLPTIFTFTVTGECETLLGVIDGNLSCAGAVFLVSATTPACTEASVVTACLPAGTYWFFVAPAAFTGCDCGSEYNASLTCATPCTP